MAGGTNQIEQIAARCFFVEGYMAWVALNGIYDAPTDFGGMTDSQATLGHLSAKDPEMQVLAARAIARSSEIKREHGLDDARPWFNLAEYLASLDA